MNKWHLSRAAYFGDFIFVPILLGATIMGMVIHSTSVSLLQLAAVPAGMLVWTLTEYGMHRFLFHTHFAREHGAHHAAPREWIGIAPWFTVPIFIALFALLERSFGNVTGPLVFIGFASGYIAYCAIHIVIHHDDGSLFAGLRTTHEMHHRGADANFGVSTNMWDHVFRTYRKPR